MDQDTRAIYYSDNDITGDISNEMNNQSINNMSDNRSSLFGFFEKVENIVGREDSVKNLLKLNKKYNRVLITGIGGSGKTSLARHCAATWVPELYPQAAFMNMETKQNANASFVALAQRLNLLKHNAIDNMHQIVKDIYDYYEDSILLIIFDNIEPFKYNINKYLPAKTRKNIFVLGTSQCTEFKTMFYCYELELISEEAAVSLVKSLFQDYDYECIHKEHGEIIELVRKLQCLPLALLHAAALIRDKILYYDKHYTISDYLKVYNERFQEPFPPEYDNHYKRTVYTALKLNIDKSIQNELAGRVLGCMVYMNPTGVKSDMFLNLSNFTPENLAEALRELSKYSIITKEERKIWYSKTTDIYIKIHRMILEIYRLCIKEEKTEENIVLTMFELLIKTDKVNSHFEFLLPYMSENLITEGYKRIFSTGRPRKNLTEDLQRVDCKISVTENWRALHYAEYCYDTRIIQDLETKAIIPLRNPTAQWSPLHAAMLNGNDSVHTSRITAKYRDLLNVQTDSGLTALHIAAATGCKGSVRALLGCKCEVNSVDNVGNTAAHWAMQHACYDIVLQLVKAGMDVNLADNEGNTLLHITATHCNKQSDIGSALGVACASRYNVLEEDQDKLIQKLVDRGADVNVLNKQGNAPIHVAAMNDQNNVVLKLISNNANTSLQNYNGDTPLLIAADKEFNKVVDTFTNQKTDIDIPDLFKNTPLHKIISRNDKKLPELAILLGANFNFIGDETLHQLINKNSYISETINYDISGHTFSFLSEKIWIGIQIPSEAREGFYVNKLVKTEDGINFLRTVSPSDMFSDNMKQFIETFHNVPLALSLAVHYCQHESTSAEELLNYITHAPNTKEYALFMNACSLKDYSNVVKLICFIISVIQEKKPQAFEFLCFVAYLIPEFTQVSTLYQSWKVGGNTVNSISKILIKYGLLEAYDQENDVITMHSLVRSITRFYVQKTEIPLIFQSIYNTKLPKAMTFILKYIDIDDIGHHYQNINNTYYKDSISARFSAYGLKVIDVDKWSVLHHAVADSNPNAWQIVNRLIAVGVNVNISVGGLTPLHLAAVEHREDNVVRDLVSAGADITAKTNESYTPLYLAIISNSLNNKEGMNMSGAHVYLTNIEEETAT